MSKKTTARSYVRRWMVLLELEQLGCDYELLRQLRGNLKRVERDEADEVLFLMNDEEPEYIKGFLIFPDQSVRVMSMNQSTWSFDELARCKQQYPGLIEYLQEQTDMEARREEFDEGGTW